MALAESGDSGATSAADVPSEADTGVSHIHDSCGVEVILSCLTSSKLA